MAVMRWQKATGKPAMLDGDDRSFDEINGYSPFYATMQHNRSSARLATILAS